MGSIQTEPGITPVADGSRRRLPTVIGYSFFWSLMFLAAAVVACIYQNEWGSILRDFRLIQISPSKLITDYFNLGSLAAAFLNAALCGFACNAVMLCSRATPTGTLLAGYFLVVAHCFYGLNFVNMWPPFLGVWLFCLVRKERFGNQLHLAMFATSLGPFISDLLFRYTLGDTFVFGEVHITLLGVVLALVFGLSSGFLIPALLAGTTQMHRGHNLFKAGLAIGLFGMFAYALLYRTMGIESPDVLVRENLVYASHGSSYLLFIDCFFGLCFAATFAWGFWKNGCTFRGYRDLWKCDGWHDDFTEKFGLPLTCVNIGIYGFCVLAYLNAVILLTEGAGYTGPTVGVTIAAITFSASGQTPRTVWPIAVGYVLLFGGASGICALAGLSVTWSISTQAYINGMAFATGLCPISGRYGIKFGILAGVCHAILCSSTAAMHGGFVLYNGGLTSGLTALLLLPILDYYGVKVRHDDYGKRS